MIVGVVVTPAHLECAREIARLRAAIEKVRRETGILVRYAPDDAEHFWCRTGELASDLRNSLMILNDVRCTHDGFAWADAMVAAIVAEVA